MIWTCPCWSSLELSLRLSCWDSGWITGTGMTWRKPRPWNWLTSRSWQPWAHQVVAGTLWPRASWDILTWSPLMNLMMIPWSPSSGKSWTGIFHQGKAMNMMTFLIMSNCRILKVLIKFFNYVKTKLKTNKTFKILGGWGLLLYKLCCKIFVVIFVVNNHCFVLW